MDSIETGEKLLKSAQIVEKTESQRRGFDCAAALNCWIVGKIA